MEQRTSPSVEDEAYAVNDIFDYIMRTRPLPLDNLRPFTDKDDLKKIIRIFGGLGINLSKKSQELERYSQICALADRRAPSDDYPPSQASSGSGKPARSRNRVAPLSGSDFY